METRCKALNHLSPEGWWDYFLYRFSLSPMGTYPGVLYSTYEVAKHLIESHQPSGLRWFSVEYLVSTPSLLPSGSGLPLPLPFIQP